MLLASPGLGSAIAAGKSVHISALGKVVADNCVRNVVSSTLGLRFRTLTRFRRCSLIPAGKLLDTSEYAATASYVTSL